MKKELIFITSNRRKVEEASVYLSRAGIEIVQLNLGYPEVQSSSLEEVAIEGAKHCYAKLKKPLFVEDSGLFIEALNGFPGPFSSYVFKTIGNQGMLRLMQGIEARGAYFKSVVACHSDKKVKTFSGTVRGRIGFEELGCGGFGFDPIFLYRGKTFAELSLEEKNRVSHRSRALAKFARWISKIK